MTVGIAAKTFFLHKMKTLSRIIAGSRVLRAIFPYDIACRRYVVVLFACRQSRLDEHECESPTYSVQHYMRAARDAFDCAIVVEQSAFAVDFD